LFKLARENKHPTTGALQKLQQDDYYPFDMQKVASAGTNKYPYKGKELQNELGQFDYGARFYDPIVARWNVVDPLADDKKLISWSPCSYVGNNPLKLIDPTGLRIQHSHQGRLRK